MPNGHLTERDRALGYIEDADQDQIAELVVAAVQRLGYHGRTAAEKVLELTGRDPDADLVEGLAQIESVEGVISGRTDSL